MEHPLAAECVFYLTLLQLYDAANPGDVKDAENALLGALASMREVGTAHSASCSSAILAHSKLLFHRIEAEQLDVADALFEQLTLLHRRGRARAGAKGRGEVTDGRAVRTVRMLARALSAAPPPNPNP